MKRQKTTITHRRADYTLTWLPVFFFALFLGCQSTSDRKIDDEFDPSKDYFLTETSIDHAIGFDLVYHNNWKEVHLFRHYNDFIDTVSFALVQRGTPMPDGFSSERIVEIPVQRLASMSTTHLGMFEKLDALDVLKGIERAEYVSSEKVRSLGGRGCHR